MGTEIPDTYGLPIYRPTKILKERVGDEVRMLLGVEVFGQVVWTHITIFKADELVRQAQEARDMALDAFMPTMKGAAGH